MLALDLAAPANWQDFESLCCDLWRRLWADPEAQKHGRSGQPQAGVDVFGRPGGGADWAGVQCKQKGRGERLTCSEITAEALKAEGFEPRLSSFIVATTAPRDARAQRAARELTDDPALPFTVSVFSWADVAEELVKHPDLLRRYYPPAATGKVRVSISRLPVPGPAFVGRDAERVYGWSFYSQGTEERLASADLFVDRTLRWLGDPDPTSGTPRDRGLRLAELVRGGRTLLVLDGVEPLQHPPGPFEGRLKDPALAALVKELAAENPGLCVVTTREALADAGALGTVPTQADEGRALTERLDLERLTSEAGAELLEHLGVRGSSRELRAAAEEFGGHALTLTLLGTYLRKACGGDVKQRRDIPLGEADASQGGHAGRVMAAYERWLGPGPEVAILRLLGLFDRPAEGAVIAALKAAPAIPELNEPLVGLGERRWRSALTHLRDCGLLSAPEPGAGPGVLDAHPLVRSCFGDRLREGSPEAWRAGHERLYDHFRRAAPELPDTLEEMMPLWAAVVHGGRAGKTEEAYDEVYRPRILRENEGYQVHMLGAFSADLTALAGFFARPWDEPAPGLTEGNRAWLLNQAGFELRALGRLAEAVEPMRAGLEFRIVQKDWKNGAISAGNLSELFLTLGDVPRAVAARLVGPRRHRRLGRRGRGPAAGVPRGAGAGGTVLRVAGPFRLAS